MKLSMCHCVNTTSIHTFNPLVIIEFEGENQQKQQLQQIFAQVVSHLLKSNELRKSNDLPAVSRMP